MRRLTAIFLCLVMILSMASCGSNGDKPSNVPATTSSDENNLTDSDSGKKSELDSDENNKGADETTPDVSSNADNKQIEELEKKYANLKEDNLTWEYDSSTKTIVISGEGPMKDYSEYAPEWDQYSNEAEKVIIGDGITSVGAGAFLWFSAITEVTLAESVEFIGDSAFNDCGCLWTINFPANLKYVGKSAFNNDMLHNDNGFIFPDGLLYIGEDAFRSAFKENGVFIPASLTHIGTGAFANVFVSEFVVDDGNPAYASVDGIFYDKNMTTLLGYPARKTDKLYEIPETVNSIRAEAIEVTDNLEKIIIPAAVTTIEEGAIFWNYALSYIDVDENNSSYKSEDGVLFSKDGKYLLSYPIASDRTEYTIPEGTERICNYAMSQANHLTKICTNEGLQEIGDTGLFSCQNLTSLDFPVSLKRIETYALTYCSALTEINYAGKNDDWQKVEIGEMNELLSDGSVTVYCTD